MRFFKTNKTKYALLLSSRIWAALVGIVLVPIYVKLIGNESYGLVAFYGTLAGALALLDLGLSTAVSRQLARMNVDGSSVKNKKDLLYSVELIYWAIAVVAGVLIVVMSQPIAKYWVHSTELAVPVIAKAVMIMGILVAFQFPISVYDGALTGLQRQEYYALANIAFSTIKAVGVIIALKYIAATVECYFIWQAMVTILFTALIRYIVWNSLRGEKMKAAFSGKQLRTIWRFAAGMTGLSIVTFFLTQVDKIVVSKYVTLAFVGYYNLAFMLAGGISQLISPFQPLVFPKFSELSAAGKEGELVIMYHKCCRWISIIVFPIGMALILFAKEILWLWTKNHELTDNTAPVLQIFVAGTICNSMMVIPYYYMLAKGITRFALYQNIIAAIILTPILFLLTTKYGIIGASFIWLSVNAAAVLISIPLVHNFYIKGQLTKWYRDDFLVPLCYASVIVVSGKYLISLLKVELTVFTLSLIMAVFTLIYFLIVPELRTLAVSYKNRLSKSGPDALKMF